MKKVTVQISEKTEQFQIPEGNSIYVAGEVRRRKGRDAIGATCHNQNCGRKIEKGDLVYSKSTAKLPRHYYHIQCAKDLNLV